MIHSSRRNSIKNTRLRIKEVQCEQLTSESGRGVDTADKKTHGGTFTAENFSDFSELGSRSFIRVPLGWRTSL
ncbi:hypothetical protein TNCV_3239111 [Trichonephila clavipes]|nr:hypothetical protein TNCV_3239111 [Trichonephila clavipes]